MRLIDVVFRQGHLSERAIIDAVVSGERPAHIDRCDICAERAVELARWLGDVQAGATDLADAAFTPERLQAQQQQIMRRLEQIDHPARVIAFPAASRPETAGVGGRRVAVSWVAVAAAAGLVIGVVSGQAAARMSPPAAPVTATVSSGDSTVAANEVATPMVDGSFLAQPYETIDLPSLEALNSVTPRLSQASFRK